MKKILGTFLVIFSAFTFVFAFDDVSSLIFPNRNEVIQILKSAGKGDKYLIGEGLPLDSPLVEKIKAELGFPLHRSLLKLNQCSRNFSGNTNGPNVLFLSQSEGGFPRHGLSIRTGDRLVEYPDLNYVDLVLNEQRVDRGDLDIYSHELGHVMMMNIWPQFPEGKSRKQHVSMGVTDYLTAFFEGWGIHFQRLTHENIPRYRDVFHSGYDYSRSTGRLWHSSMDKELRLDAVLKNDYIHQKLLPSVDTSGMTTEDLILLEHTSPIFDRTRLKNAQQMLSCEGVIATLFYRINTNSKLQSSYQDRSFYTRFLLSPIPEGSKPQDIFSPFENIFLKNFWVWDRLKERQTADSTIFIEFIDEWRESFPEDAEEILKIFLLTTVGRTVNNNLAQVYMKMASTGMIGNIQEFRPLFQEYSKAFRVIMSQISSGESVLDANIGPQLWIENNDVLIRTTLWSPDPKLPLFININTASVYDLTALPGIGHDRAESIIKKREKLGYFKTIDEARIK
ncbi:ComEA family DNA-binding protein [Acidobacteriota bacterium]